MTDLYLAGGAALVFAGFWVIELLARRRAEKRCREVLAWLTDANDRNERLIDLCKQATGIDDDTIEARRRAEVN